ncbi:MAG: hypothetical protein ACK55L_03220, partial [bacterium]
MQQVFAHNRNEISAFAAELVFCEVPGEFLQWGWDGEGVGVGIGGGVALIDAVGGGVAGVSPPPVCLCFLAADGLAFGLAAGALAVADSWVRIEPPQAIPAGALPQSGHPLLSARLSGGQLFVGRGGQVFASAEELTPNLEEELTPDWDAVERDVMLKLQYLRAIWEYTASANPEAHKRMKRDLY